MNLAIVTSYFNPCGYRRMRENYYRFVELLGALRVHLYTAELVLDDDEPLDCPRVRMTQHGRRPDHCLWQKERLLNAAWQALPAEYDAVAWIDCDVVFPRDSHWYERASSLLNTHRAMQLFEYADLLDASGEPALHRRSVVACRATSSNAQGAWGLAWAARRDDVSLPDFFVAGGGDVYAGKAFLGEKHSALGRGTEMLRAYEAWLAKQKCRHARSCAYLRGVTIRHLFHGKREARRYTYRDGILAKHSFDPKRDVVPDGAAMRWSDPKSPVAEEVRAWFDSRREDD